MFKNGKGDVIVLVAVLIVIALIIRLGLWAAFSAPKALTKYWKITAPASKRRKSSNCRIC
jgi:hypothetical protein